MSGIPLPAETQTVLHLILSFPQSVWWEKELEEVKNKRGKKITKRRGEEGKEG